MDVALCGHMLSFLLSQEPQGIGEAVWYTFLRKKQFSKGATYASEYVKFIWKIKGYGTAIAVLHVYNILHIQW